MFAMTKLVEHTIALSVPNLFMQQFVQIKLMMMKDMDARFCVLNAVTLQVMHDIHNMSSVSVILY